VSGITTHVLDVSIGKPAAGIDVRLERKNGDGEWETIGNQKTDSDGRANELYSTSELTTGVYRLLFDVGSYFGPKQIESFYEKIVIAFNVKDSSQHYHVPLLLSPFGYSTYRGS
jgi:5-hydroxyisourate hydrolase